MNKTNFKLKIKVLNRAVSFASLLLAAGVFIVVLTACPNTSGGSGGTVTPSDVGSFEDAGNFVKITPPTKGIIGAAPKGNLREIKILGKAYLSKIER